MDASRICGKCLNTKPVSCYNKDNKREDGLQHWCRECQRDYRQDYHPTRGRDRQLRRKFGITLETYNVLLTAQSSGCAICGYVPQEGDKPLYVDHCHETEAVRSLLCVNCNFALGHVKDDVEILQGMIRYLEKHRNLVNDGEMSGGT